MGIRRKLKSRGASLADLKDEHRAALDLLKELGGVYPGEKGFDASSVDIKPSASRFGLKFRSTIKQRRDCDSPTKVTKPFTPITNI